MPAANKRFVLLPGTLWQLGLSFIIYICHVRQSANSTVSGNIFYDSMLCNLDSLN